MSERRKIDKQGVVYTIETFSKEIEPVFITKKDYVMAIEDFKLDRFSDFEDLIILNSVYNNKINLFIANNNSLLKLKNFKNIKIISPND